ncbi:MAG: putative integral rane protein [Chloroflexota bacterium]|nr:putative integral rane protein [Chloroflexota bacterium]
MDTGLLIAILLLIHILGAIVGFGPTFAFAILGPMSAKAGPQGGMALLEAMHAIEQKMVVPVAVAVQPLSGLALIFVSGWNVNFFSHYWLWIGILLYAAAFYLAIFGQNKRLARMIEIAKAGPPTPEFVATAKRLAAMGPVVTVLLVAIIVLMVTKPGG